MRRTSLVLAGSLVRSIAGQAMAQGVPGSGKSGGNEQSQPDKGASKPK